MPRDVASLTLALFAAACASGGAGSSTTETAVVPVTTSLVNSGGTLNIAGANTYSAIGTRLAVRPDSAFKLLEAAYAKLEIPVSREDVKGRSIGNDGLKVRRRIGGITMQTVVDCGEKMGLKNAETWDIFMNILSFVVPDGPEGSQVSTRIQATGHDPTMSGRDEIPCGTRGELEAKIGNTVKLLSVRK